MDKSGTSSIMIISESARYRRSECVRRRYANSNKRAISRVYSPTSGLPEEREEKRGGGGGEGREIVERGWGRRN